MNHDLTGLTQNIEKSLADFPELVHSWRFLAGVLYALRQYAEIHSPAISNEQQYIKETDDVLTSMLNKQTPKESWQKGFYYNAALMRLDAAYERFFKTYLHGKYDEKSKCITCGRNKIDGKYLYTEIRKEFSNLFPEELYEKSNFYKVRRAVNSLKHYIGGADVTEREQPEILEGALNELVMFLRDPLVIKELKKFSGQGILAGRILNKNKNAQQSTRTDPD